MGIREVAYEGMMLGAQTLLRVAAPFNEKLRRGVAGRAFALERLREWSRTERRLDRPLVWLHAPSVGEALMAQAIVSALRELRPDMQIAFTHFSPSAEQMRDRVGADITTYLSWDTTRPMRATLETLRPAAIAFVRTEIWPTLVRLAHERNIPAVLVNGVLAETSSRLKPLARLALRPAYAQLGAVGAINQATVQRFARLGVPAGCARVTGDARFDQVWQRVGALQRENPLLQRMRDATRPTIVAGSTWPGDHEHLFAAFQKLPSARLIVAPHEPTEAHLSDVERATAQFGLESARLAQVQSGTKPLPPIVLVDRVGLLADLYSVADVAYVGGAFHGAGVHSVVEPAALGVPVLFGPNHGNAAEAQELIDAGGAAAVAGTADLSRLMARFASDVEQRRTSGSAARAFVQSKLGGAHANAALIAGLIEKASG
jgi:3-deoxy-D-manno-octulosonic-acid transferase